MSSRQRADRTPPTAGARRRPRAAWAVVLAATVLGCGAPRAPVAEPRAPRYVFAWPFVETEGLAPRGGTTQGAPVTLAIDPADAWRTLRADGLAPAARDRAAILAMAGDYRTSFDFLETVVFEPPYRPAQPYRSWATERVYVVEDRDDFVSLQHVLVMVFVDEDGRRQGPFVQKHWRQDWRYEPRSVVEYVGRRQWRRRDLAPDERRGAWSQSVYQVDDSPRYASVGRWRHERSFSAWTGDPTGRPLPRREHTVRKDYDLLTAVNRHTILPHGWVHEEDNLKRVLPDAAGGAVRTKAREIGVNRYDRIRGFDFSAADAYWRATGPLWAVVRRAWAERLAGTAALRVATACAGTPSFVLLFEYAARLEGGEAPASGTMEAFVDDLLDCIVTPAPPPRGRGARRSARP